MLALGSSVAQAELKIGDPAKLSQVRGYWKLVEWPVSAKRQFNKIQDPWPSSYQWFVYSDHNRMYHVNLNTKPPYEIGSKYLMDTYEKHQAVMQYQFNDGYMWVYYSGGSYREVWKVSIAGAAWQGNGINAKTGDLFLALLDSKGREVYYRQLRRI